MNGQTAPKNQVESNSSGSRNDEPDWKELAKISLDEFKNRRELEWKLALGFWAAIASFTYVFMSNEKVIRPPLWMLDASYLLVGLISVVGLIPVQAAHATNKAFFYFFMNKASKEQCRNAIKPADNWYGNWSTTNWSWLLLHAVTSITFLWISWFLVSMHKSIN